MKGTRKQPGKEFGKLSGERRAYPKRSYIRATEYRSLHIPQKNVRNYHFSLLKMLEDMVVFVKANIIRFVGYGTYSTFRSKKIVEHALSIIKQQTRNKTRTAGIDNPPAIPQKSCLNMLRTVMQKLHHPA
jgi:hypothetical protein